MEAPLVGIDNGTAGAFVCKAFQACFLDDLGSF